MLYKEAKVSVAYWRAKVKLERSCGWLWKPASQLTNNCISYMGLYGKKSFNQNTPPPLLGEKKYQKVEHRVKEVKKNARYHKPWSKKK